MQCLAQEDTVKEEKTYYVINLDIPQSQPALLASLGNCRELSCLSQIHCLDPCTVDLLDFRGFAFACKSETTEHKTLNITLLALHFSVSIMASGICVHTNLQTSEHCSSEYNYSLEFK